ncbi:MAG: acyl-CoA dehydrogenase [Phototrophicales bacterium]|nr:MAG: acyl-CoA dehydrogenase [Phototrophicales bacterium]
MDFELSSEHRQWQRVVAGFCQEKLKPHAAETAESAQLPWDVLEQARAIGLLSMDIPEAHGGSELDALSAAIAMEELGRACGSTALSLAAHNGLGCAPIARWGTAEQQAQWFPLLQTGRRLGALALTEPGAGSDLAGGVQTRAVREGDEWVINGSKAWITNAGLAPVITVLVRTDPDAGTRGFSMMLVNADAPGLTIHPPEKKMGLMGSPTHMLSFDNVRVPASYLLGEEGRGFAQTMQILDSGRIGIGALSVGLAQAALEESLKYAGQREAFGKPIAQHQAIQWMLADAATEIEAARLMVFRAAWLKDRGMEYTKQAAMAKLFATETAERVCHHAIQIHGSYGYSREFPVERLYRDQRLMTIGEGTSEIQRLVIARRVLAEAGL